MHTGWGIDFIEFRNVERVLELWRRQILGGWCFGLHRLRHQYIFCDYWSYFNFNLYILSCEHCDDNHRTD